MKKIVSIYTILFLSLIIISCSEEEDMMIDDEMDIVVDEPEPGIDTLTSSAGVQFVRTPDAHFQNLPDWPYDYQYVLMFRSL